MTTTLNFKDNKLLRLEFIRLDDPDEMIARAIIIVSDKDVDESEENYYIPIDYWSRKQYVENWLQAIDELEAEGKGSFILLADKIERDSALECYMAWKIPEGYVFQNVWLAQNEIDEPIDIKTTWKYMKESPSDEMDEVNISQSEIDELKLSLKYCLEKLI